MNTVDLMSYKKKKQFDMTELSETVSYHAGCSHHKTVIKGQT